MTSHTKSVFAVALALAGAGVLCPLCAGGVRVAGAQQPAATPQTPDTATLKLHISGMTCGSCPATARIALRKLPGVLSATVTLDDSLGVVRYDQRRVAPAQIATHLTRLTGYGAKIISDTAKAGPR